MFDKSIKLFKKKKENFLIFFIIIIFLVINNFFYDFYFILKTNYKDRMIYHYGYCDKSGYGFIKFIQDKYKLNKNIKILNSLEKPNSEWFIYKINKEYYSNKLILLNYNDLMENIDGSSKIYFHNELLGNYNILESYKNCFFVKKVDD